MTQRSRFTRSETSTSTIELKSHQERMQLEARRDYLKWYLDQPPKHQQGEVKEKKASKKEKEEKDYSKELKAEIMELEGTLQKPPHTEKPNFVKPLLLPKIGKDEAGISRTLSVHFAQLFKGEFTEQPEAAAPFVELSSEGLEFYWGTEKQANEFAAILEAHHMTPQVVKKQLDEKHLPPSPECDRLALKNLYCQPATTHVTKIPHLQAERLLRLAQYHPYHLKAAQGEWYQAKGLDHSKVAVLEALKEEKEIKLSSSASPPPLQLGGMQRVVYDEKEHLVRVTINTEIKSDSKAPPPHVVILLDNSGSMGTDKMPAANAALKKLIMETLDENTLVSIQPMNADTLVYRKTVKQIRQEVNEQNANYFNTSATGGTPLVQLLVNSAVFLREDPQSTIISEAALRNTVIVPITDGEDNGGFTAEQAVLAMQTSANPTDHKGMGLLPNIKLPTGDSTNPVSYGVGNFQCRQLPAVLPIRIGHDSDAVFSRKLAEHLHAPEAFVNDESKEMQQQIDYALSLVKRMSSRVPEALVGLVYEDSLGIEHHVVSTKEHNFFHLSSRDLFFKVPKDAKNLRVCIVVDDQPLFISYSPAVSTIENEAELVLNQYVAKAFDDLQRDYFTKQNVSLSPSGSSRSSGGRGRGRQSSSSDEPEAKQPATTTNEQELQQKFLQAKEDTQKKIQELLPHTTDTSLQGQMRTFSGDVRAHQYKEAFSDKNASLYLDRAIAATQQRVKPIDHSAQLHIPDSPAKQLWDSIEQSDFKKAEKLLEEKEKTLIDDRTGNPSGATPLIFALIQLRDRKKEQKDCTGLRKFIRETLLPKRPNLLLQDKEGNTALHRAAWYKEEDICHEIIDLAREQGTLDKLISCRNRNVTGATQDSETPLDNMRARFYAGDSKTHPKDAKEASESFKKLHEAATKQKTISAEDCKEIEEKKSNCISTFNTESKEYFSSYMLKRMKKEKGTENYHLHEEKYQGETQLMHLVREANDNPMEDSKVTGSVCAFLEEAKETVQLAESDYAGNTLLHDVIRLKEFSIAEKVLDIAAEKKQLTDVLAARNIQGLDKDGNGGQVPHMALAAVGSECVKDFFTIIAEAKPLI